MATKKKKRKTEDENREFRVEWTEMFAFIRNSNGLPTCLICQEKLSHNKKSNLKRHFTTKHSSFENEFPAGDARKKAIEELQKSQNVSSSIFDSRIPSCSNANIANFVVKQEITKRGKPYTDASIPLIRSLLPSLTGALHKGQCGRVAVIGGSAVYTGAPFFSAMAALKVGADMVHIFCPPEAAPIIKSYSPELMVHPSYSYDTLKESRDRVDVFVVGPGLGREKHTATAVKDAIAVAIEKNAPIIIDADGLFHLADNLNLIKGYKYAILTPNYPEFNKIYSNVFGSMENDEEKRISGKWALALAKHLGVVIFQKGERDIITDGETIHFSTERGSFRRCGGQGDVLDGALAICSYWAMRFGHNNPMIKAALASSQLIRMAASYAFEKHGRSMMTTDLLDEVEKVIAIADHSTQ